jgi:hypothetical protein
MRCSDGNSLPFWKIAHQKIMDLNCLPMIYIRTIETGREIENQMIGSGLKLKYSTSGVSSDFLFGGPTLRSCEGNR